MPPDSPTPNPKAELVQRARELFMQYGVRSITMSELASRMGISKKTVYQYFEDKEALVEAAMVSNLHQERDCVFNLVGTNENPVHAFLDVSTMYRNLVRTMKPHVILELKRYYPKVYALVEAHKQDMTFRTVQQNLKRGIASGHYRATLDPLVLARFFAHMPEMMMQTGADLEDTYGLQDVFEAIFTNFLQGLLTDAGREAMATYQPREDLPSFPFS